MKELYAMLSVSPHEVVFHNVYMESSTVEEYEANKSRLKEEMKRPVLEGVIARLQEELAKLPPE